MPGGALHPERQLRTLERLLEIPAADLPTALGSAADAISDALRADKVDAFLHDPARDTLVAVGRSNQPLSELQRRVGLDVLQIANGGRVVEVFQTGRSTSNGRLELDEDELRGVKEVLGVRSQIGVALEIGGARRGALMIASLEPDFFTPADVAFTETVARWLGVVAHRAELVEEIARNAVQQGRRAVAEELITVLAHDLRNFIAPIELRLATLHRRAEKEARERDSRDLDLTRRSIERLTAMIDNVLDVARIDQGVFQMDVRPVDLLALMGESARTLSAPERHVVVRASEAICVYGDPDRLRQCIENLISNGVKHSPKGAPVLVSAQREHGDEGESVRIDVIDEGPGVPTDILPRVFDRFVSGPNGVKGLGLGLYLSKRIAELHGGDLKVDRAPGKGARFTLTLPCCADSSTQPVAPTGGNGSISSQP